MHLPSNLNIKRLLPGIVAGTLTATLLLSTTCRAQEPQGTPPPLQPVETPPPRSQPKISVPEPEPEPVAAAPSVAPKPTPRIRAPKATPPPTNEPVAVVNGAPVYRPLFKSAVADPVDRALMLQEYRRRGYVLPANALEQALKNQTKTGFSDPATLQAKLQEQGASNDDYRGFVAEEVKLQAMLSVVSKGGRTDAERKQMRDTWIAGLRKNAAINKPATNKPKKA